MEQPGTGSPYQLQGTLSSLVRTPMLRLEHEKCSCSFEDRQHCCSGTYQQNGRHALYKSLPISTENVELVFGMSNDHLSRTPPRFSEPTCRLGITNEVGFIRMGSRHEHISEVNEEVRPLLSRPFCIPTVCKAPNLLQLEIRPRCGSSECPMPAMEHSERVCLPTLLSHRQMPNQNQIGGSPSNGPDNTTVEITDMVPTTPTNVGGDSDSTSKPQEVTDRSTREQPSHDSSRSPTTSRLDCVRSSLQDQGLSEGAIKLLCASWRNNTEASYSSCWRLWARWCATEHINPIDTSVEKVIEFFTVQF